MLGVFNFWVIQWFFFRVCYREEPKLQWGILFPVLPLTGWWSAYIPKKPLILMRKS